MGFLLTGRAAAVRAPDRHLVPAPTMTLDSVVRCRFLGHAQIEIAHTLITPEAERLFALLAVLATEAGVPRHRDDLTTLLWSDQPEERGKHNLRQTLYKARQLGVQLETSGEEVVLAPSAVWCDWQQTDTPVHGEWLGAYTGSFSDPFASWVVSTRVLVHTALRPRLVAAMQAARASGDLRLAEQHATQLLRVDPLNEEATLVLAECIAMAGAKVDALRLLDEYAVEVGEGREMSDAVLPARVLRTRIAERLPVATYATGEVHDLPLVGRESELKQLLAGLFDVRGGRGGVTWVWGPEGIGKSRLVHEVLKAAAMQGVRVVRDGEGGPAQPLRGMVARLLDLPGSLGVDPSALQLLRAFAAPAAADAHSERTALLDALTDLLGAVTSEHPVFLVIERPTAWELEALDLVMQSVLACGTHECGVLLTSRVNPARIHPWPGSVKYVKVSRLDDAEMQRLLEKRGMQLGLLNPQEKAIGPALAAEGNPSFGIELLGQSLNPADGDRIPFRIREAFARSIAALADAHRRVLTACWAHGASASEAFLGSASAVTGPSLDEALTALLESGLVRQLGAGYAISRLLDAVPELVIPAGDTSRLLYSCARALRESFRTTNDGREAIRACQLLAQCDHKGMAAKWLTEDLPAILRGTTAPAIIAGLDEIGQGNGFGDSLQVARAIRDEILHRARGGTNAPASRGTSSALQIDSLPVTSEEEQSFTKFSSQLSEYLSTMETASNTTVSPTDRVRAACHAVVLADNLYRPDLVQKASEAVETIAMLGSARPLDVERARLISASCVSNAADILAQVAKVAETARTTPDIGDASRALRNAAEASLLTGDSERARELLLESIRMANNAGYARQVAQSYVLMFFVVFAESNFAEGQSLLNEAKKHARANAIDGGALEFDVILAEAYLMIALGDHQSAKRRVRALQNWLQRTESPIPARQIRALRLASSTRSLTKDQIEEMVVLAGTLGDRRPDVTEDRTAWALRIASRNTAAEKAVDDGIARLRSVREARGCIIPPLLG